MQKDVPVLLAAFRRPNQTLRVLEAVRAAGTRRLFVVVDRPCSDSDRSSFEEVLGLVRRPGWADEVRIDVAGRPLGLRDRLISGLDWFFEHVEEGIILEDDCLPHASFFRFSAEMLDRYRGDPRVMHINGSNIAPAINGHHPGYSYTFTQIARIWGWATWRRAWKLYDASMASWPAEKQRGLMQSLFRDAHWRRFWTRKMDGMYAGRRDTWDYPWIYACLLHRALCVVPSVNLITNVGDDPHATHRPRRNGVTPPVRRPVHEIEFPLKHPPELRLDHAHERRMQGIMAPPRWRSRIERLRRLIQ